MQKKLSILMIVKNSGETITKSLQSVQAIANEIVVVCDCPTDCEVAILKKYRTRVFINHESDLGRQRAFALKKCHFGWVLVLDCDELVGDNLKEEIVKLLNDRIDQFDGYLIPIQTHLFGRKLNYGGENYKKLVLFKKEKATIKQALVNERFVIESGRVGLLKNKIYHYSYRDLWQMYSKFTDYAIRDAKERLKKGEKTSLKKIFLYPSHMFWARFIKDRGYKDGLFRIPLDLGFAYMEFVTYILMIFIKS